MSKAADDRFLYLLKSRGGQTAAAVGATLGMTAAGAQQRLARLAEQGLVTGDSGAPADGAGGARDRGRPRKYWRLTEAGHARFPDRHSDLTLELLRSTEAIFGAEGLERLIRHREAETLAAYRAAMAACDGLQARVARLAELRSQEGYMAAWTAEDDGGYLLVEQHCPICAAAETCQGLCRSELDVFTAVLGPGVAIERIDHILAGARRCAYRIVPTDAAESP